MRVPLGDLAQFGVVKDVQDYALPPNAWTDSRNVRFKNRRIVRFTGHQEALAGSPIAPYWLLHVYDNSGNSHWIVAGLAHVYDYSSGAYTQITRAAGASPYSATAERMWNGGVLGNLPIINNGVDKPQLWSPVAAGTDLVDLTNWPATHTANVIRIFDKFVFALDITEGGTRYPHRVRVSHPALPGAVPSSWDDTDATKDVYVAEVSSPDSGFLIDALPMRNVMILYKERATWGMQFIGGRDKWRLFELFSNIGCFQPHCVCSIMDNAQHFVMTGSDIIVHEGQSPRSLLTEKQKEWFLSNIDKDNYSRSFVVHNETESECWACFPLVGATLPNMAIVWNYLRDTITFREIGSFSFIAGGQIPVSVDDPWDSDVGSWDSDMGRWDNFTHPPFIRRLLAADPTATKLHHLDFTDQFNGANFTAYVERTGLDVIGLSRSGEIIRDREQKRLVKRLYIQASGSPFYVQLGQQEEIDAPLSWSTSVLFTPREDKFVDFEEARDTVLFGLRFHSTDNGAWEIVGLEPDVEQLGAF